MTRTKMIGWSAFAVCLLGYGSSAAVAVFFKLGHLDVQQALLFGGPLAVIGEIGLWVAAGTLGWTIFKRRKALFDRMFRRKPREV
ncbi:hypothetical protein GGQ87_000867 [Brevundimonas alba]|uniref:Uncharacterized protein n=1 Tax=Brevundimonas alba TaxID=74314 RepID=A0A7X6BN59_9CAUL|nr:hypothetical protein [Brevundimonas alba]NJC40609.1 hypothetical protein [Brevundimonas alba]